MAGFKFIYGCVTIHVMSGSRERFINMCHHRKICLEHVISGDEYLEAVISARNFRTACEIAKKTGNKIRIKKKKGIPFIAFRYRKHYSFVAGVVHGFYIHMQSFPFQYYIFGQQQSYNACSHTIS